MILREMLVDDLDQVMEMSRIFFMCHGQKKVFLLF